MHIRRTFMIKSMTGFGRCEVTAGHRKLLVEIKSVNHRYLDINLKLPKKLNCFESSIRSVLKEYLERGKTDVFITYANETQGDLLLRYNEAIAGQYLACFQQMEQKLHIENDIRVSTLAGFPEVFTLEEQTDNEEELWELLEQAIRGAVAQLVESRIAEGKHLSADISGKLDAMLSHVAYIEERSPQILAEYKERLNEKVAELLGDRQMDDARIAAEITIFADKVCVDEETVRLKSHIQSMKDTLDAGGCIGRKLDFIAQELNREANTILSKTTDIKTSDVGISLKTDIEKVREQIQNIE